MKTAIVLYEPEQLASLDALIERFGTENNKPHIVSLDAEIDFSLEKRGIPFISGKTLQNRTAPDAYMRSDEIVRDICESESLSSLSYRNVSVLHPLRLSLHQYFQNLLYYVDVIQCLAEIAPGVGRLVIPASLVPVSPTSGPLAVEEVRIVEEAARLVAEGRRMDFESHAILSAAVNSKNRWEERTFALKRMLFGFALWFLNAVMALRPHCHIRLLASDYWRNLAPLLRESPEAEVVLLDRSEAFKAGLSNIWRHKIRFMHIKHFLSWKGKRRALTHAKKCREEWKEAHEEALASIDLTFRSVQLLVTSKRIMTHLIENAVPSVIRDIEGTYAMYERLSPDIVLLRASVSGQRHFAILPLVAREMGIPALEVQHGGEYLGPGSATRQHPAYFFVAYGKLVCDEFRSLGYEEERLLPVGSPRFDAYVKNKRKRIALVNTGISILSNTPSGNIGERYGTYSVEEYFHALGEAARMVQDSHLVIASRSDISRASFLKEARERGLHGVPYESAGAAPLPELFAKADLFVCSHSTVVYEALLCGLPVVIASFAPVEKMMTDFHFSRFRDAGALAIAHTPEELCEIVGKLASDTGARARMSAAGEAFMREQFSFDGHAAERIARLIRDWSKQKRP